MNSPVYNLVYPSLWYAKQKQKMNLSLLMRYSDNLCLDVAGCTKDKLSIADTVQSANTCGTSSASSTRKYPNGDVSFHFTTDGSGSGRGFMLTYKLIDKPVQSKL